MSDAPSRDLTSTDPHTDETHADGKGRTIGESIRQLLWKEVELLKEEYTEVSAYVRSLGDRAEAAEKWFMAQGEKPMTTFLELMADLKSEFPLAPAVEPVHIEAPTGAAPQADLPGDASPESEPPATSESSPTPPPVDAPESPSADAPAVEASAPSPEPETPEQEAEAADAAAS